MRGFQGGDDDWQNAVEDMLYVVEDGGDEVWQMKELIDQNVVYIYRHNKLD